MRGVYPLPPICGLSASRHRNRKGPAMTSVPDHQSVQWLHKHGRSICYYSDMDPFTGRWTGLAPRQLAGRAVQQIVLLCMVFDNVILPPGYLLKNPAAGIVFHRLMPLFEQGYLSISIDQGHHREPWIYFEEKIEAEMRQLNFQNLLFFEKATKNVLKTIVKNGRFLFRDSSIQIKGFGEDAAGLAEVLSKASPADSKAFTQGLKCLQDHNLLSSRDDWIALLHHPAYRPPPIFSNKIGAFIHRYYFQQGFIGNHCVMYPSEFLIATGNETATRFPAHWNAYHAAVIRQVLIGQGIDADLLPRLSAERLLTDVILAPAMQTWRQAYHEAAGKIDCTVIPAEPSYHDNWSRVWGQVPSGDPDWGKKIAEQLVIHQGGLEPSIRSAVRRMRYRIKAMRFLALKNTETEKLVLQGIPGVSVLDLQARIISGWRVPAGQANSPYEVSYFSRAIRLPGKEAVIFDRSPFLIFLALLQKHGDILSQDECVAIAERMARVDLGPVQLKGLDGPENTRADHPISYPELNTIISKLRRGLKSLAGEDLLQTDRKKGWRLTIPPDHFVFLDVPMSPPLDPAGLLVRIHPATRTVSNRHKQVQLSPLPFQLLQLLIRYQGAPVSVQVINAALGLLKCPSDSTAVKKSIGERIRQHLSILSRALDEIDADLAIANDYATGWRLVEKAPV